MRQMIQNFSQEVGSVREELGRVKQAAEVESRRWGRTFRNVYKRKEWYKKKQ